MNGYFLRIEVPEGEVEKIMKRLDKAQKEISECYNELVDLGVLKIVPGKGGEETPKGDSQCRQHKHRRSAA